MPSNRKSKSQNQAWGPANLVKKIESGAPKYEDVCRKIQESVERNMKAYSHLDEEEEDDEEELEEDHVLERVLGKYDKSEELGRTHQFLTDAFKKGSCVCLICIENIKQTDEIWSCVDCFTSFHIGCIQKWAKDSLFLQAESLEQKGIKVDVLSLKWCCPKCRCQYIQRAIPSNYLCFCGKQKNPKFDPWLLPHSCGEHCGKPLKPSCGHNCLLLCHPGPCPTCPITVQNRCYCGKQAPQTRRCSSKQWSCNQKCGKNLLCGQHMCENPCHEGDCPPCPRKSNQKCLCGSSTSLRSCAEPEWQCEKVCGKMYSCKHHKCELVCHSGSCGDCPSSGQRKCSCGKSSYDLPCTTPVPNCGDTCSKLLACGMHYCSDRCHKGSCATCLQFCLKPCRCGTKEKEMACSKEYTCETKCKKMRDCGKHLCNRKCCTGDCPPCKVVCGKTLMCGNHKCESRCHTARCYPCPLTFTITCSCKATSITVPCGRERSTKPPKCSKLCTKPPTCHHPFRKDHKCHFGNCPPCKFICEIELKCKHKCKNPCHDAVPVKVIDRKERIGPWEKAAETYIRIEKQPCPPCKTPVPNTCRGLHETSDWSCSELRHYSCGRICGRPLDCDNHQCELECHVVEGATGGGPGKNCQPCERPCSKPRPPFCPHICREICHKGDCKTCTESVFQRCNCGFLEVAVECEKLRTSSDEEREKMRYCFTSCAHTMSCGHICNLVCHSGNHREAKDCTKKVSTKCPCKRLKKDVPCNQQSLTKVACDDVCKRIIKEKQKESEMEKEKKRLEEELRHQKEVEEFERKMEGKKRHRNRKRVEVVVEETFWQKYRFYIFAFVILFISLIIYWQLH